ncbi:unnamed protein product [Adineta ricciae]|uniref:Uncharacterized protein n=1 Tax=Adineta ricciae TaxID=249248 RepID=A0A815V7B6_ADIRI|nr:unnamed protein product [Adineta ricciae]CAF1526326.1 unnamed protein product [Adineta ricciae]
MAYKNTTDSVTGEAVLVASCHIYPAHTTDTPSCGKILNRERINLESYQLIWLDSNTHSVINNDTAVTLTNLRKIVDYTKLYNEKEECIQYIKQTSNTTTFLVCSGSLGEQTIPIVHSMNNIWTIYIFCQNKDYHEKWATNYSKIKRVYTKLVDLLNDLKSDVQKYIQNENDISFIGAGREDNTTIKLHNDWWPYFVDFLCYLPYPANYQNHLIDLLKQYYAGKKVEIEILKDFAENYTPKKAIWWYTCETFLYRLVNQALRQRNIKIVFLFGFFLRDIYTELQQQYQVLKSKCSKQSLKLYRGQIMSVVELENLLKCCKNADTYRIIITSFFSTSLKRFVSLSKIPQEVEFDKFVRVLFEITIDVAQPNGTNPNGRYPFLGSTIRPFGDISTVSRFPEESEILFMPGSGFQLNKSGLVFSESENLWIIQLEPVDDHFHAAQEYFISSNARRTLQNCITAIPFELQLQNLSLDQINMIFDHLIFVYPMEK